MTEVEPAANDPVAPGAPPTVAVTGVTPTSSGKWDRPSPPVQGGRRSSVAGSDAADQPGPALECRDLVVRYGSLQAVDGLSLQAEAGEVLALLGPNGAGKTSTLESLEGYRRPDGGTVRVLGVDPSVNHRRVVGSIGVMLQRGGVYPMLGPRQALELFAAYYEEPEDTGALLELVDLQQVARTPWRHLSGGEQQRLSLALALVGRPQVLFLDEPTAGVDPEGRLRIRAIVRDLAAAGTCILLTTHELAEAERMADRVAIIRRGQLMASGTPGELAAGLAASIGAPTLRFGAPSGLDLADLSRALRTPVIEVSPGNYEVDAPATPQLTAALTGWLAERDASLTDLRTGRSLEEAYLALVGSKAADALGDQHRPGRPKRRGPERPGRRQRAPERRQRRREGDRRPS